MLLKHAIYLSILLTLKGLVSVVCLAAGPTVERVTTAVPFPRGLAVDNNGDLYVLARGRVRGAGGVSSAINDRAGTIYRVNVALGEPINQYPVSSDVRNNAEIIAEPTNPPFHLWNRDSEPPESDRLTDRPYCTLRYHEETHSFYICAFSGIDKPKQPNDPSFSKNLTDAVFRYDIQLQTWHEIERHNIEAGGSYPHHDVRYNEPPHGWLNGPNNCLPIGGSLYVVSKDNSMLVRYDLNDLRKRKIGDVPRSYKVLGSDVNCADGVRDSLYGHSALAYRDGYLYIGTRTSSVIFRIPLSDDYLPQKPVLAEIVARFDPYNPETGKSANITDMGFDDSGYLYVVSAKPSRVYRFKPNPDRLYDATSPNVEPWADLAKITANPAMKSENLLFHDGYLYVTSGDGYDYQQGASGTVYRIRVNP